jgi:hypothetical protein
MKTKVIAPMISQINRFAHRASLFHLHDASTARDLYAQLRFQLVKSANLQSQSEIVTMAEMKRPEQMPQSG